MKILFLRISFYKVLVSVYYKTDLWLRLGRQLETFHFVQNATTKQMDRKHVVAIFYFKVFGACIFEKNVFTEFPQKLVLLNSFQIIFFFCFLKQYILLVRINEIQCNISAYAWCLTLEGHFALTEKRILPCICGMIPQYKKIALLIFTYLC